MNWPLCSALLLWLRDIKGYLSCAKFMLMAICVYMIHALCVTASKRLAVCTDDDEDADDDNEDTSDDKEQSAAAAKARRGNTLFALQCVLLLHCCFN